MTRTLPIPPHKQNLALKLQRISGVPCKEEPPSPLPPGYVAIEH